MYGFNHDEAIRSFHAAAEADPQAAMPWWAIAYSHGININDPEMTEERSKAAREAADKALERIGNAPLPKKLIESISKRRLSLRCMPSIMPTICIFFPTRL